MSVYFAQLLFLITISLGWMCMRQRVMEVGIKEDLEKKNIWVKLRNAQFNFKKNKNKVR